MLRDMGIRRQLWRYALVGLSSNLFLYLVYLAITWFGVDHKISVTIVYALGIALSFAFNRGWTFGHEGEISSAAARYLTTYLGAYFVNLFLLFLFVDKLGYRHEWVQAALIFVIAGMIFLMQKFWVFHGRSPT